MGDRLNRQRLHACIALLLTAASWLASPLDAKRRNALPDHSAATSAIHGDAAREAFAAVAVHGFDGAILRTNPFSSDQPTSGRVEFDSPFQRTPPADRLALVPARVSVSALGDGADSASVRAGSISFFATSIPPPGFPSKSA